MTEQEFKDRLAQIDAETPPHPSCVHAGRDQRLALLFGDCGFSNERIAVLVGKSKTRVQQYRKFAKFLRSVTARDQPPSHWLADLTEWAFRLLWNGVKGHDAQRFAEITRRLSARNPCSRPRRCSPTRPTWRPR